MTTALLLESRPRVAITAEQISSTKKLIEGLAAWVCSASNCCSGTLSAMVPFHSATRLRQALSNRLAMALNRRSPAWSVVLSYGMSHGCHAFSSFLMGRSRSEAIRTNQPSRSLAVTPERIASSLYLARPQSVLIQRKAAGTLLLCITPRDAGQNRCRGWSG